MKPRFGFGKRWKGHGALLYAPDKLKWLVWGGDAFDNADAGVRRRRAIGLGIEAIRHSS